MKYIILLNVLFSFNVFAVDNISFQIEKLNFQGDQGAITSKEINIGDGSDSIGYKSKDGFFEGVITAQNNLIEITASNGMYIKSTSPIDLKDIPATSIENGSFSSTANLIGLKAKSFKTSVSNIQLRASDLDFSCIEGGSCKAHTGQLIIDSHTMIAAPDFSCLKASCSENFQLDIPSLDQGNYQSFTAQPESFIELHDLRSVSLKRQGQAISFNGKMHVLVAVLGFELKGEIVNLTDEVLEIHVNKVEVSKILSLRDFTMFLAKKFLSTKSLSMNGDNLIIKLKE